MKLKGLGAKEKVKVFVDGKLVAKGKANKKGVFEGTVPGQAQGRRAQAQGGRAVQEPRRHHDLPGRPLTMRPDRPPRRRGPHDLGGRAGHRRRHVGSGRGGRLLGAERRDRRGRPRLARRRHRPGLQPRPGAATSPRRSSAGPGFSLTYVQRQPGFVCRINGAPASDPCVNTPPADAYWGLWWSDGKSGSWTYSSVGRRVADRPGRRLRRVRLAERRPDPPGVPADAHTPAPRRPPRRRPPRRRPVGGGSGGGRRRRRWPRRRRPTPKPSATPTAKPSTKPPATSTTTPTPTATAVRRPAPARRARARRASSASASHVHANPGAVRRRPAHSVRLDERRGHTLGSASTSPRTAPDASPARRGGALPAWVVPLVLVALAAGGGAAYLLRRRHRPSP